MNPKTQQEVAASLPTGYNTPGEYVHRFGEAIHPLALAPTKIEIKGTLAAPFDFLTARPELLTAAGEKIRLEINNEKRELDLFITEKDPFTTHIISGKLNEFADLKLFGINTERRWTVKNFINHCRMFKFYFADKDACEALIRSLQMFTAKVETVIKQHNDNSGNSLAMLETKLEDIGFVRKFTLLIPIFKGSRQCKIEVEICLEPKASSVDIYLISDDLALQERTEAAVVMADELKKFDKYAFSKVVIA